MKTLLFKIGIFLSFFKIILFFIQWKVHIFFAFKYFKIPIPVRPRSLQIIFFIKRSV